MENLFIEATTYTPEVILNKDTGFMQIKGRCIPENPEDFWPPILNWFDSYLLNPAEITTIKFDLDYFNIFSSKRILFLLYKVDELIDDDHRVTVEWCYKKNDEDMYEVGQDYAHMVRITFLFLEVEEVL